MKLYRDIFWVILCRIPSIHVDACTFKNMVVSGRGIFALYGFCAKFENLLLRFSLRDFIEILQDVHWVNVCQIPSTRVDRSKIQKHWYAEKEEEEKEEEKKKQTKKLLFLRIYSRDLNGSLQGVLCLI